MRQPASEMSLWRLPVASVLPDDPRLSCSCNAVSLVPCYVNMHPLGAGRGRERSSTAAFLFAKPLTAVWLRRRQAAVH